MVIIGIYCIYEDRNNRLWIGTEKGLYLFNKDLDKFQQINGLNIEKSHISQSQRIHMVKYGQRHWDMVSSNIIQIIKNLETIDNHRMLDLIQIIQQRYYLTH